MAMEAGFRRLSLREARVARLVAEGLSDEQVAERLGIGVAEVSAELAEVFRKLGLRSRTELALLGARRACAGSSERRPTTHLSNWGEGGAVRRITPRGSRCATDNLGRTTSMNRRFRELTAAVGATLLLAPTSAMARKPSGRPRARSPEA